MIRCSIIKFHVMIQQVLQMVCNLTKIVCDCQYSYDSKGTKCDKYCSHHVGWCSAVPSRETSSIQLILKLTMLTGSVHGEPLNCNWFLKCECVVEFLLFLC